MNQPVHDLNNSAPETETVSMHVPENDNEVEKAPNDISMEDTEVNMENQP